MTNGFMGFTIGAKCSLPLPEGASLQFAKHGVTMFVNISSPDSYEKKSFKSGRPVKFGVSQVGRMGFVVADFGDGFCFDMPFDVGIENDEDIPHLMLSSPESRLALFMVAVDSKTKKVFGLRMVTLSPKVTAAMSNLVSHQRLDKISMVEHEDNVSRAFALYPNVEKIMDMALARCQVQSMSQANLNISPRREIQEVFSSHRHMLVCKPYHSELPPELAVWHCYVLDCGHSILGVVKCFADKAFEGKQVRDYLAPISVKTALRGYQMREGYVVVDVEYDKFFGVMCPDEDDEF